MTTLLNDLRYAWRQLLKAPGFAITAVLTLALGIGISAAMFTVLDGVLLRPLPVPHPSRVVRLGETNASGQITASSLPDLRDWRDHAKSFQDIGWYIEKFFDLRNPDGTPQFSVNEQTSPNFFSMLQAQPLMGRTFLPQAGVAGNQGTVVLSHFVWQHYFHADKNILGKQVQLGKDSYNVIGVMPWQFYIPINDDGAVVWTVLPHTPDMEQRNNGFLHGIGRLRSGVSITAARTELSGIQGNIARQFPDLHLTKNVGVQSYLDWLVGSVRPALLALQGAVLLVWLIACANIAGLMLTRMAARRREIAVRAALGAARGRIVRQFLTESMLLGVAGGAGGLGIAYTCLAVLRHSIIAHLNRSGDIALNWQVILLLIVLSIVSAVIFGTIPAFQAASADPQEALHEGSRGAGAGVEQLRLRNALIVGELALSLVLLVSAGLLLRTLYALRQVPVGFNPQHLVVAQFFSRGGFTPTAADATSTDLRTVFYDPLLARVRQIPGVESAAFVTSAPLTNNVHMNDEFSVIGDPEANASHSSVELHAVTPGAYRTLEVRLLQGRRFNDGDRIGTTPVVIVNQAFARQYLGAQPLQKRLDLDTDATAHSILQNVSVVGIVEDTPDVLGQPALPEVDIDLNQIPLKDDFYPIFSLAMELVVRTGQPPEVILPTISRILSERNAEFVVNSVQTMPQQIDGLLGSQTLAARLLWIFAIAAVLIAAAGLYGLLSYSVGQRTREIGVRLALGAQREDVLRMILRQASRLLIAGLVIGVFAAYFTTRLVRSFLYGVAEHDWLTIVAVSILLVAVGLVASYVPARRAAKIEPVEALRAE
ncbi:MAG TPA: ABC transporter permease [Acidobacteriaceae bacterium]|nr:ABC transporter permease [Acidobacteriaceae bacterium]